jgi:hypothetical protein
MHEPALQRSSGSLSSIGYTEFAQDVVDVTLHRGFANPETRTYFFVTLAAHDQLQYFHLSAGKVGTCHSLRQSFGYCWGNPPRAGVHSPNRRFQFLEEYILQEVAFCSSLQRPIDIFVTIIRCEYDQASPREFTPDSGDSFDSADDGHPQID